MATSSRHSNDAAVLADKKKKKNRPSTFTITSANLTPIVPSPPVTLVESASRGNKKSAQFLERQTQLLELSRRLQTHRRSLPIYSARGKLIEAIRTNSSVIVVGETGSGKTTQLPQYLVEAGFARQGSMVGVTQPRRVAATSLADRVGQEMGSRVGYRVGYSVRFKTVAGPKTLLKFLTDGMLLRELISDPYLASYSVIVLDEAHERTVRTDILFGMVKSVQRMRRDMIDQGVKTYPLRKADEEKLRVRELKVVVMSATLDAERFSDYFGGAPILYVSGRQHSVQIFNTAEPQTDYLDAAVVTTFQIHQDMPPGDILVFLTGQEEIESVASILGEHAQHLPATSPRLCICPLFAALPAVQQAAVFDPAPSGCRKVILATNIAETSITIPGIRYVVDTGVAKMRGYNARIGIESLTIQPISRASARQRSGRAGRECPGICYRLYTEKSFFAELPETTEPEIRRCDLAAVVLMLKAAGVENVVDFEFMDRPSRESLQRALESLYALEAISKDGGKLTSLGRLMAEFPIDPMYARALIKSKDFACTSEVVDIIALLSAENIFFTPNDKKEEASQTRKKFMHPDGDHLSLLNVFKAYQQEAGDASWCRANFLSVRAIRHVVDVRRQLQALCNSHDLPLAHPPAPTPDPILQSFLAGFFTNTALLQPDGTYRSVLGGRTVHIHPTSALFGKRTEAIVFDAVVCTTREYVRGVSCIQANWLSRAAPRLYGCLDT